MDEKIILRLKNKKERERDISTISIFITTSLWMVVGIFTIWNIFISYLRESVGIENKFPYIIGVFGGGFILLIFTIGFQRAINFVMINSNYFQSNKEVKNAKRRKENRRRKEGRK